MIIDELKFKSLLCSSLTLDDKHEIYNSFNKFCTKYLLTSTLRASHLLAQLMHESWAFKYREEAFYYDILFLRTYFKEKFRRYSDDQLNEIIKDKPRLANILYAKIMGNKDENSSMGYLFRGRGYIQITYYDNYKSFADFKKISIDEAILYLDTIEGAMEAAFWYWHRCGLNSLADKNDIKAITIAINGPQCAELKLREDWLKIINEEKVFIDE